MFKVGLNEAYCCTHALLGERLSEKVFMFFVDFGICPKSILNAFSWLTTDCVLRLFTEAFCYVRKRAFSEYSINYIRKSGECQVINKKNLKFWQKLVFC